MPARTKKSKKNVYGKSKLPPSVPDDVYAAFWQYIGREQKRLGPARVRVTRGPHRSCGPGAKGYYWVAQGSIDEMTARWWYRPERVGSDGYVRKAAWTTDSF